jgi:hypothetical protein
MGRVWCGVLCPEGALAEFASRHGRGKAIPKWLRWGGWPFLAFVLTTLYGQLVSVYEYPQAALLILGGSTVAAVAVGWLYGKRQARLVPLPLPGLRRLRPARAHRAGALPHRPRRLGQPARTQSRRRLRAAARRQAHDQRRPVPRLRPLQRPPRRRRTLGALAQRRGARWKNAAHQRSPAARLRHARRGHRRLPVDRQPVVRRPAPARGGMAGRARTVLAAGNQRARGGCSPTTRRPTTCSPGSTAR